MSQAVKDLRGASEEIALKASQYKREMVRIEREINKHGPNAPSDLYGKHWQARSAHEYWKGKLITIAQ